MTIQRLSDKRKDISCRRYVRPAGTGFKNLAACGCLGQLTDQPGSICRGCGGAVLTDEECARWY